MSTTFYENDKYSLTQFYGGDEDGVCLQITSEKGDSFIQLTLEEAKMLVELIKAWIKLQEK